jgi:hypothetical protein
MQRMHGQFVEQLVGDFETIRIAWLEFLKQRGELTYFAYKLVVAG